GMSHKQLQQLIFLRRELHLFLPQLNDAPHEVDGEFTYPKYWTLSVGLQPMAQCSPHPGQQFVHAKRLGDIVVRAKIECLDFRDPVAPLRYHQDWNRLVALSQDP